MPLRSSMSRAPATNAAQRWRCSPSWRVGLRDRRSAAAATLLDAVETAIGDIVAASARAASAAAGRRAAAPRRRAVQLRAGDPSRPAARRGAESPPAQLSRILRAAAFRRGRRHGRRRDHHRRTQRAVRHRPAVRRRRICPGFVVHVEICEDIWVPVPPSSQAALAGATVLANLSASNITIGKAETRRLLCASQSARCLAAYLYAAAGAGESTTDLAWDGQASIFENGATLAETERFPADSQFARRRRRSRPAAPGAHADGQLRRQPPAQSRRIPARRRSGSIRRPATSALRARSSAFPSCRPIRTRLEQDCYEAYNIQVEGLAQRLRATGIKRVVIGVSGGLDSTHALIVAARALDLLGLPRANILAYTMPGFATSRRHQDQRHRADARAGVTCGGDRHPARGRTHAGRHRPSVRARRAGLRRHVRERAGGPAHRLPVPPGQPARRHRDRHRRSVRAGAGLVHLRRRRPDVALQRQCRRAEDADPAPDPLGDQLTAVRAGGAGDAGRDPGDRDLARTGARRGRRNAAEHRGASRAVRAAGLQPLLHAALRLRAVEDRVPGVARLGRRGAGRLAAGLSAGTARRLRPADDPQVAGGVPAALLRVQPVQALGDAERPEGHAGGSLSPRGDWRAPSDGNANAWLAELDRNVPKDPVAGADFRPLAP